MEKNGRLEHETRNERTSTYTPNDLPATIVEKDNLGGSWVTRAATTFTYDHRSRLTAEQRTGQSPYYRVYEYDAGGNRTKKRINPPWGQEVWYHYDVDADADPALYGSKNNRVMYEELMYSGSLQLVSTTYYEYSADGNVTRVITEQPAPPAEEQFMAAGAPSLDASGIPVSPVAAGAPSLPGVGDGGGAEALVDGAAVMRAAPPTGPQYSAVRLGYAANGRTVTFAHGETWTGSSDCPSDYQIPWAREFRYDGARARYMNAPLNPATLAPYNTTQKPTVWSDYDGGEIYGDFEMVSGSPVNKRSFEAGIARTENPLTTPVTNYYHSDLIGTTRLMSSPGGGATEPAVYTVFGERISTPSVTDPTRYGYVGAWGYGQNADFPFLHVGARYYDPSSGRFLQRDPIGILGGINVYAYASGTPTDDFDPEGLSVGLLPGPPKRPWDPMAPRQDPPGAKTASEKRLEQLRQAMTRIIQEGERHARHEQSLRRLEGNLRAVRQGLISIGVAVLISPGGSLAIDAAIGICTDIVIGETDSAE